ncbi:TIR domain-containing protein [Dyadobacter sp. CY107]|uniref:Abi-alpha family protein n=1 Tax=Dyadobacter fanqingshengii TaxID=2906443 RepID=UPI001F1CEEB8|nr:TIR domain-containing protein [Dyadobacter fanqingshengii]MCF2502745.1 TIR domain-containing protein [Dyadobacter fanqingshengii]
MIGNIKEMNPRVKYQYHQRLINLLADSYPFDKLHKIFAGYFTSDLDPTKYNDKIKFLEDQIERLDDKTIDTIARDHGMNPEIEDIMFQIAGASKNFSSQPDNANKENKDRITMNAKQRHDICNKLIDILSSSTHKQVESLLHGYGLHEGHNSNWGLLSDYIENVLVASDDEGIIKMEKDFNLGILTSPKLNFAKPEKDSDKNEESPMTKKIFISHASVDKEIVEQVIEYIRAIGVPDDNIFCTSFPGYGIPLGENFLDRIRVEIRSDTIVIFVLSHNFYKSAVSLCEMGAAWVNSKEHIPVLIPPFEFNEIKGVIPLTQGMRINDKDYINELKEKLEIFFNLKPKKQSIWEKDREKIYQSTEKLLLTYSEAKASSDLSSNSAPTNTQSVQIDLFLQKIKKTIKDNAIEKRELPYKVSKPLLEGVSLEDNDEIQQMWINLYLNYVDKSVPSINEGFPVVFKDLSASEVKFLKYMYDNDTGINVNERLESLVFEQHEVNNLVREGLIERDKRFTYNRDTSDEVNHGTTGIVTISPYGKDLMKACSR